jgi:hypothetical protein
MRALAFLFTLFLFAPPVWAQNDPVRPPDTITADEDTVSITNLPSGRGSAAITVSDYCSCTLVIEGKSHPADAWEAIDGAPTIDADGVYGVSAAGLWGLRVRADAWASGTTIISMRVSSAGGGGGGAALGEVMVEIEGFATEAKQDSILAQMATDNAVLDDIADGIAVTGTVTANLSATDNAVLDDIADGIAVTATNLDVQSGGADLATEVTLAAIATDANDSAGSLAAIEEDIDYIRTNLSIDADNDALAPTKGPMSMCYTQDQDGSALPGVVSAETDATRVACSLYGVQYFMLVDEDGDTNVGGALQTALELLDNVVGVEDAGETAGGGLAMAGSVRRDAAAASAGTTGDNATVNTDALGLLWTRQLDPCTGVAKTHIPINISTATTTELTAALAGASTHYYVCGIDLVTESSNGVALVDDDTDNCASVTSGLAGGTAGNTGWQFAANGGLVKGDGQSTVFKTGGTNRVLCLVTSTATQLSGSIQVVAAP